MTIDFSNKVLGEYSFPPQNGTDKKKNDIRAAQFGEIFDAYLYPVCVGKDYKNDVFEYYAYRLSPKCTCGQEAKEEQWFAKNVHTPECFHSRLMELEDDLAKKDIKRSSKKYTKAILDFAKLNNFPAENGKYIGLYCDCGHMDKYLKWAEINDHDQNCTLYKPNFKYFPANFEIRWYHHPFQSAISNYPITFEEWVEMLKLCVTSTRNR